MALNPLKKALTKASNVAFFSMRNLIHRIERILLPVDLMNPV
jgi:hypothetical protein